MADTTYELHGEVAVITIARPDSFNAVDADVARSLIGHVEQAGDEARALVLTGAGRAFSAGVDLTALGGRYRHGAPDLSATIRDVFNPIVECLHDARVPTVAAVNGAAAGAGLGIALACDLRVMAASAYLMAAFINVAVVPDTATSFALPRMVGLARAMEIAFSGRRVGAEEAVAIGLAHRVAADGDTVDDALAWATSLADGPTAAYVATRHLLLFGASHGPGETVAEEQRVQGLMGVRPEHAEAVTAFLDKRRPDFRAGG